METTIKSVRKLLDKFILPEYDDIMEYHITSLPDEQKIEIIFWMDGTEQEVEEEIVYEIQSLLKMMVPTDYWFVYKFTTDGEHFYSYS